MHTHCGGREDAPCTLTMLGGGGSAPAHSPSPCWWGAHPCTLTMLAGMHLAHSPDWKPWGWHAHHPGVTGFCTLAVPEASDAWRCPQRLCLQHVLGRPGHRPRPGPNAQELPRYARGAALPPAAPSQGLRCSTKEEQSPFAPSQPKLAQTPHAHIYPFLSQPLPSAPPRPGEGVGVARHWKLGGWQSRTLVHTTWLRRLWGLPEGSRRALVSRAAASASAAATAGTAARMGQGLVQPGLAGTRAAKEAAALGCYCDESKAARACSYPPLPSEA